MAEALTGTPVKELTPRDESFLTEVLADDEREIDCCQLNELLLLVNKDRMEPPFFDRFFGPECHVSTLGPGVQSFQKTALLCFGNFIFAYRKLSHLPTAEALQIESSASMPSLPAAQETAFQRRPDKLIDVEDIERQDTPLVGYLSAGAIVAENRRATFLKTSFPRRRPKPPRTGKHSRRRRSPMRRVIPAEHQPLRNIIAELPYGERGGDDRQTLRRTWVALFRSLRNVEIA